ncbi:unnamed protein product [Orchesella dallaii]|uniref:Uncharacterized protein n=1 Tax=Orchesella dallaii TaxID=48710 RepID=A0ABP1QGK4_9HEXA
MADVIDDENKHIDLKRKNMAEAEAINIEKDLSDADDKGEDSNNNAITSTQTKESVEVEEGKQAWPFHLDEILVFLVLFVALAIANKLLAELFIMMLKPITDDVTGTQAIEPSLHIEEDKNRDTEFKDFN